MARTSKTIIGDRDRDAAARRAAAEGGAERQAAERSLAQEYERGSQTAAQYGQMARGVVQDVRAAEDLERVRGSQEQAQRFGQEVQSQQLQLGAAAQGMQQSPEAQARLQALQAEMDRGERQAREQGAKPIEMTGEGPSAAFSALPLTEAQKREEARKDTQAQAQAGHAFAAVQNALINARKLEQARLAGDAEAVGRLSGEMDKEFDFYVGLVNKLNSGSKGVSQGEYLELLNEASQIPGVDPSLIEDLQGGQMTPRIRSFLNMKVGKAFLDKVQNSRGDLPKDVGSVSFDNPVIQKFMQWMGPVRAFFAANPLAQAMAFRGLSHRNRIVNYVSSLLTKGQFEPQAASQVLGTGGMPPPALRGAQPVDPGQQQQQQPAGPDKGLKSLWEPRSREELEGRWVDRAGTGRAGPIQP